MILDSERDVETLVMTFESVAISDHNTKRIGVGARERLRNLVTRVWIKLWELPPSTKIVTRCLVRMPVTRIVLWVVDPNMMKA